MAKSKYDGVVEAVHYNPDGHIDWVRAFERRGFAFSDYILITRDSLIDRLRSGEKFMTGKRVPLMANTFQVSNSLRLVDVGGRIFIVAGDGQAVKDHLAGVPII